ncbi:glutamine synthetase beta-grasp domain-containing protein [Candidatus Micrarchaeota archaeon]|nr:glutamine synthetase beta-grasp domain-containing protein [Candidatus Micrarchaeota archaeon]
MPSPEDVFEYITSNNMRWVDLQFSDVEGRTHRTTINAREVSEASFTKGIYCGDLKEIFGWAEAGELVLLPDPDTFGRVPWEPSTLRMLCNVVVAETGERFLKDSRYVPERAHVNSSAMGFTDATVSSQIEFYVLDNVTVDKVTPQRGPNCLIESREAPWSPSPLWNSTSGAYLAQPYDTLYSARVQVSEVIEDSFRYIVTNHFHGRSGSGQQSLTLAPLSLKTAADAVTTTKFVARNLAMIANSMCTFMGLPISNERGNSLLAGMTLWKKDENAFYDSTDKYAQLSQTGRYFIGGLLEHAPALMVFTNPNTNSYKRLSMDPRYIAWGKRNSSAVVRVENEIRNDRRAKKIVFNLADPSANPYLAYGVIMAAGLDGIKKKADPGKAIDEDLTPMDEDEMKKLGAKMLPSNILEAIAALESDNKFLKGVISSDILETYLEDKIEEHREQSARPTAYEFEKYFNL